MSASDRPFALVFLLQYILYSSGVKVEAAVKLAVRFLEAFAVVFLQIVQICVNVKDIAAKLDHRNRNVGAVIGNSLVVRQKIIENKPKLKGAFTGADALYVADLDLVAQIVDDLLKRLYL